MSTTFSDPTYSAENYLEHRPCYPRELYETILEFHKKPIDNHRYPPPERRLALDVGCGPGIATVELLPFFDKVIGVDESQKMVATAKSKFPQAEFHVGHAHHMPMMESGTVDLITVATAAHWFPFNWWEEAGRILKPGGTVALWVYSEKMILEPSHTKSVELSSILATLANEIGSHTTGNKYASEMYDTLPLPTGGSQFTPATRISWNRKGSTNESLCMSSRFTIETLRKRIHTYSPVHRWRAENPSKKDTPDDPVEKVLASLKNVAGWDESTEFIAGYPLSLILMKRL